MCTSNWDRQVYVTRLVESMLSGSNMPSSHCLQYVEYVVWPDLVINCCSSCLSLTQSHDCTSPSIAHTCTYEVHDVYDCVVRRRTSRTVVPVHVVTLNKLPSPKNVVASSVYHVSVCLSSSFDVDQRRVFVVVFRR